MIRSYGRTAVLLAGSPGGNLYVSQTLGPNSGDVMPLFDMTTKYADPLTAEAVVGRFSDTPSTRR
jgi:hypothetical protein